MVYTSLLAAIMFWNAGVEAHAHGGAGEDMVCVGEIESKDEDCGEFTNKEDCESAFKSPFSDGLCDWVPKPEDSDPDHDHSGHPECEFVKLSFAKPSVTCDASHILERVCTEGCDLEVCEEACEDDAECSHFALGAGGLCRTFDSCETTRMTPRDWETYEKVSCMIPTMPPTNMPPTYPPSMPPTDPVPDCPCITINGTSSDGAFNGEYVKGELSNERPTWHDDAAEASISWEEMTDGEGYWVIITDTTTEVAAYEDKDDMWMHTPPVGEYTWVVFDPSAGLTQGVDVVLDLECGECPTVPTAMPSEYCAFEGMVPFIKMSTTTCGPSGLIGEQYLSDGRCPVERLDDGRHCIGLCRDACTAMGDCRFYRSTGEGDDYACVFWNDCSEQVEIEGDERTTFKKVCANE